MYRRRQMHPSSYWFKIVNRKNIRIDIPIPPNHIKWMIQVMVRIHKPLLFNPKLKISLLVNSLQLRRLLDISLTKRRVFHQLSKMIAITAWCIDWTITLYNQKPIVLSIKINLVYCSSWYNYIVAILKS